MSIIHEIHGQSPFVRYTLFGLAIISAVSVVGYFGFTTIQRDMFVALHADPQEQADFIAQQEANRPKPLAALARMSSSLTASIGSMLHINSNAGFDRGGREDNTQGGVHLLPLSE
jgi:hypothetical protein